MHIEVTPAQFLWEVCPAGDDCEGGPMYARLDLEGMPRLAGRLCIQEDCPFVNGDAEMVWKAREEQARDEQARGYARSRRMRYTRSIEIPENKDLGEPLL